jgi:hypothetical protein
MGVNEKPAAGVKGVAAGAGRVCNARAFRAVIFLRSKEQAMGRTTAAWALVAAVLLAAAGAARGQEADGLLAGFRSPPDEAKPQTWWHWMNGNVSREGITLDLEAMKRAGIGGFQMFQVGSNIPVGPVKYGTPENLEMV